MAAPGRVAVADASGSDDRVLGLVISLSFGGALRAGSVSDGYEHRVGRHCAYPAEFVGKAQHQNWRFRLVKSVGIDLQA